jgi:hypothetical protein
MITRRRMGNWLRLMLLGGMLGPVVDARMAEAMAVPTTVTVASSANPATATSAVTLTATIDPADATGTVAFMLDGGAIAGCETRPVAAGTATCPFNFNTVGTFALSAAYGGDATHLASTSATVSQAVTLIPTTTTVTPMSNPASASFFLILSLGVSPAGAPFTYGAYTLLVNGQPYAFFNGEGGPGQLFVSFAPGTYQVAAHFNGGGNYAPSDSVPFTLTILDTSPRSQYFAEGATGSFFQTTIGILNASANGDTAFVRFSPESGAETTLEILMGPLSRRTIDVNQVLGPVAGVSTSINSCCFDIVATRRMTWGTPVYGSTLQSGLTRRATTWYFAEGATNVFSLFYLIYNPTPSPANITLTHLLEGGQPPVVEHEAVPANSRRTFYINDIPGLAAAAFSTVITADVGILAERAMYLNTGERLWEGGTVGRGATSLDTTWSFAEGATGFFHTYLLLGNPGVSETSVTVRYQLADGTVVTKTYTVAPQSRRTIDVGGEDPLLQAATFGIAVTSTLPIVAERAMWWGLPFYEGSVSSGAPSPGTSWAIGEGVEGGPDGAATFVLVSNATAIDGTVRFTVVYDDGTHETKDYPMAANARLTARIGDDFVKSRDARFSVIVDSLTADVPITVETAQYQSTSRPLEAGDATMATRLK